MTQKQLEVYDKLYLNNLVNIDKLEERCSWFYYATKSYRICRERRPIAAFINVELSRTQCYVICLHYIEKGLV